MVRLRLLKTFLIFGGLFALFLIFAPIKINLNTSSNSSPDFHSKAALHSNIQFEIDRTSAQDVRLRDRLDPNSPDYQSDHYLIAVWRITRGLINTVLVVVLLLAAFANILHINVDTYTIKKVLPAMVLGVILANFSLFICRMFLDLADVLSTTFVGASITDPSGSAKNIADSIVTMMGLKNITAQNIANGSAFSGIIGTWVVAGASTMGLVLLVLILIIFLLPVLLIFLLALLFWARGAFLQFMIMIAPVAFFALAFPFTQQWFKKWWGAWTNWVFMKPIIFFLLWIGSVISNQTSTGYNFITWVMGVFLLVISIAVPFKLAGAIGGTLSNFGNMLGKMGLGFAGRKIGATAQRNWARVAAGQKASQEQRANWQELQQLRKSGLKTRFEQGDNTLTNEDLDKVARLESLEKKIREGELKPYNRGKAALASFGFGRGGGLGWGLANVRRRSADYERESGELFQKAQLLQSAKEASDAVGRGDSYKKLARLKELTETKTKRQLTTNEGKELDWLTRQEPDLKRSSPKQLDKVLGRILKKRIAVIGFDEAKWATADDAVDFFEKNKTAVENYKGGKGYLNTAQQNFDLMVYGQEMKTDLSSPARAEFADGAMKAQAFGIPNTEEMRKIGITPELAANKEAFRAKIKSMSIADRRLLAVDAIRVAKGSYSMADRPFKRLGGEDEAGAGGIGGAGGPGGGLPDHRTFQAHDRTQFNAKLSTDPEANLHWQNNSSELIHQAEQEADQAREELIRHLEPHFGKSVATKYVDDLRIKLSADPTIDASKEFAKIDETLGRAVGVDQVYNFRATLSRFQGAQRSFVNMTDRALEDGPLSGGVKIAETFSGMHAIADPAERKRQMAEVLDQREHQIKTTVAKVNPDSRLSDADYDTIARTMADLSGESRTDVQRKYANTRAGRTQMQKVLKQHLETVRAFNQDQLIDSVSKIDTPDPAEFQTQVKAQLKKSFLDQVRVETRVPEAREKINTAVDAATFEAFSGLSPDDEQKIETVFRQISGSVKDPVKGMFRPIAGSYGISGEDALGQRFEEFFNRNQRQMGLLFNRYFKKHKLSGSFEVTDNKAFAQEMSHLIAGELSGHPYAPPSSSPNTGTPPAKNNQPPVGDNAEFDEEEEI